MSKGASPHPVRIDQFFAGPGARADQWRLLVELAEAWAGGSGNREQFEAALADMTATEGFHAYPGSQLLTALRDHADYPRSICRHANHDPETGFWQTVFSVIIEPQAGRMLVTRGTPCDHAYEEYRLK